MNIWLLFLYLKIYFQPDHRHKKGAVFTHPLLIPHRSLLGSTIVTRNISDFFNLVCLLSELHNPSTSKKMHDFKQKSMADYTDRTYKISCRLC
jgi:hypothetical protein